MCLVVALSSSWHRRLASSSVHLALFSPFLPDEGWWKEFSLHFYQSSGGKRLLKRVSLTARRACLSLSFSVRILCCSALSVRRFSCTDTTLPITSQDLKLFRSVLPGLTILLTSAISSSSSFFLWMKWASIRDWSSDKSFSWRFLWMSCYIHMKAMFTLAFSSIERIGSIFDKL